MFKWYFLLISVKKHPNNTKLKVCSIEGTKGEIDKALKMIRDKFPVKRYPDLTLEQVHFTPVISTVPLIPDHLYVSIQLPNLLILVNIFTNFYLCFS